MANINKHRREQMDKRDQEQSWRFSILNDSPRGEGPGLPPQFPDVGLNIKLPSEQAANYINPTKIMLKDMVQQRPGQVLAFSVREEFAHILRNAMMSPHATNYTKLDLESFGPSFGMTPSQYEQMKFNGSVPAELHGLAGAYEEVFPQGVPTTVGMARNALMTSYYPEVLKSASLLANKSNSIGDMVGEIFARFDDNLKMWEPPQKGKKGGSSFFNWMERMLPSAAHDALKARGPGQIPFSAVAARVNHDSWDPSDGSLEGFDPARVYDRQEVYDTLVERVTGIAGGYDAAVHEQLINYIEQRMTDPDQPPLFDMELQAFGEYYTDMTQQMPDAEGLWLQQLPDILLGSYVNDYGAVDLEAVPPQPENVPWYRELVDRMNNVHEVVQRQSEVAVLNPDHDNPEFMTGYSRVGQDVGMGRVPTNVMVPRGQSLLVPRDDNPNALTINSEALAHPEYGQAVLRNKEQVEQAINLSRRFNGEKFVLPLVQRMRDALRQAYVARTLPDGKDLASLPAGYLNDPKNFPENWTSDLLDQVTNETETKSFSGIPVNAFVPMTEGTDGKLRAQRFIVSDNGKNPHINKNAVLDYGYERGTVSAEELSKYGDTVDEVRAIRRDAKAVREEQKEWLAKAQEAKANRDKIGEYMLKEQARAKEIEAKNLSLKADRLLNPETQRELDRGLKVLNSGLAGKTTVGGNILNNMGPFENAINRGKYDAEPRTFSINEVHGMIEKALEGVTDPVAREMIEERGRQWVRSLADSGKLATDINDVGEKPNLITDEEIAALDAQHAAAVEQARINEYPMARMERAIAENTGAPETANPVYVENYGPSQVAPHSREELPENDDYEPIPMGAHARVEFDERDVSFGLSQKPKQFAADGVGNFTFEPMQNADTTHVEQLAQLGRVPTRNELRYAQYADRHGLPIYGPKDEPIRERPVYTSDKEATAAALKEMTENDPTAQLAVSAASTVASRGTLPAGFIPGWQERHDDETVGAQITQYEEGRSEVHDYKRSADREVNESRFNNAPSENQQAVEEAIRTKHMRREMNAEAGVGDGDNEALVADPYEQRKTNPSTPNYSDNFIVDEQGRRVKLVKEKPTGAPAAPAPRPQAEQVVSGPVAQQVTPPPPPSDSEVSFQAGDVSDVGEIPPAPDWFGGLSESKPQTPKPASSGNGAGTPPPPTVPPANVTPGLPIPGGSGNNGSNNGSAGPGRRELPEAVAARAAAQNLQANQEFMAAYPQHIGMGKGNDPAFRQMLKTTGAEKDWAAIEAEMRMTMEQTNSVIGTAWFDWTSNDPALQQAKTRNKQKAQVLQNTTQPAFSQTAASANAPVAQVQSSASSIKDVPPPTPTEPAAPNDQAAVTQPSGSGRKVSHQAAKLAAENGIDINDVPGDKVGVADVRQMIAARQSAAVPAVKAAPVSDVRKPFLTADAIELVADMGDTVPDKMLAFQAAQKSGLDVNQSMSAEEIYGQIRAEHAKLYPNKAQAKPAANQQAQPQQAQRQTAQSEPSIDDINYAFETAANPQANYTAAPGEDPAGPSNANPTRPEQRSANQMSRQERIDLSRSQLAGMQPKHALIGKTNTLYGAYDEASNSYRDDNNQTTISSEQIARGWNVYQGAVAGAYGPSFAENANPNEVAATVQTRVKDMVKVALDQYEKELIGKGVDPLKAAEMRKQVEHVTAALTYEGEKYLKGTLEGAGGFKDLSYASVNAKGDRIDQYADDEEVKQKIEEAGGINAVKSGAPQVWQLKNGAMTVGSDATRWGRGQGSWEERFKSLRQTDFGRVLMAGFMARQAWTMTGGDVLNNAAEYGMSSYEYVGMSNYGEGHPEGATMYAARQELGRERASAEAYGQYGFFNQMGYMAGNMPHIGTTLTRLGNDAKVAAGLGVNVGIGAYVAGGLLANSAPIIGGLLGAEAATGAAALGATAMSAAAPVGLAVGAAALTGLGAMSVYNGLTGQDPYSGSSAKNWLGGQILGMAEAGRNPLQHLSTSILGPIRGMVMSDATYQEDYVKKYYNTSVQDYVENSPVGRMLGKTNVELLYEGRDEQSAKLRKLTDDLSDGTGFKSSDIAKSVQAMQLAFGGIETDTDELQAKFFTRQMYDQGLTVEGGLSAVDQIAGMKGIVAGTDEYQALALQYAALPSSSDKQKMVMQTGQAYQKYGQWTQYVGTTRAAQLYQDLGRPNEARTSVVAGIMANAENAGIELTDSAVKGLASQVSGMTPWQGQSVVQAASQMAHAGSGTFDSNISTFSGAISSGQMTSQQLTNLASWNKYEWSDFARQNPGFTSMSGAFIQYQEDGLKDGTTSLAGSGVLLYARQRLGATNLTDQQTLNALGIGVGDNQFQNTLLQQGMWGAEQLHADRQYGFQMASIGIGFAQLAATRQFYWGNGTWDNPDRNSSWGISDRIDSLQYQGQMAGFATSLKRLDLGHQYDIQNQQATEQRWQMGQDYQNWMRGFDYQTNLMQRGWTQQDWQYQSSMRQMQYGWQMEDFDEAIRRSSGYERQQLIKQRDRATQSNNMESNQIEQSQERQKELWEREDQRYQKSLEYSNELAKLDQEDFERSKNQREALYKIDREDLLRRTEEAKELHKLQLELQHEQRRHTAEQLKFQEASLGIQAAAAAEQKKYNDDMRKLAQEQERQAGAMNNIINKSGAMRNFYNDFITFLNILLQAQSRIQTTPTGSTGLTGTGR
jgi:hypothetical protein